MVFVWCQSINPFLRYGNVNIWQKWPWRSRSIDPIFNRVLKGPKIHILCENGDSRSNPWRVIAQTSSNLRKSVSLSPKWPWRSRSIDPIFNRVLKGPKIHIQCENGDSRSNPWRVIAQTSSNLRKSVSLSPKWPWRSRSIDPIFNRVLKGPKIHIQCENGDSRSNPWRVIAQTSSNLRKSVSLSPKWPWRSRSIDPIFNRVLKGPKIHIQCENGDSRSNPWRVIAQTSSNLRKSVSLSPKWPWRSRSIDPIFNRVLKGPKIHIQCENGDSRSNPWRVIAQTSSKLRNPHLGRPYIFKMSHDLKNIFFCQLMDLALSHPLGKQTKIDFFVYFFGYFLCRAIPICTPN